MKKEIINCDSIEYHIEQIDYYLGEMEKGRFDYINNIKYHLEKIEVILTSCN